LAAEQIRLQHGRDEKSRFVVRQMMDNIAELIDGSSYDLVQRLNAGEFTEAEQIALAVEIRDELIAAIVNLGS